MKGYIFVSEKNNKIDSYNNYSNKIKKSFSQLIEKDIEIEETINNNLALYNLTNEKEVINFSLQPYHFAVSGHFLDYEAKIFEEFRQAVDKDMFISNLGGIFSFACLKENTFTVWNNVTRAEPVYWAESSERIVVGTKALIVHLLALGIDRPVYDASALTSFLNNGFYCDEKTPFKGINVLERNSRLEINDNKVEIKPIDSFENNVYSIDPDNKFYDEITDLFLDSFKFLKKHNVTYKMGLTGGKDSRLVIAAMNSLGLSVETGTTGYDDTPDVIIGKRVAELLNIPHKTNFPARGETELSINLLSRTMNVIKNCEGMLYSYENISGVSEGFNDQKIQLGGQGGELLRGGYAKKVNILSKEGLIDHLKNGFNKYRDFFQKDASEEYNRFLYDFVEKQPGHLNYNDVLNSFYLSYRAGRWSATSRSAYTMGFHSYAPLFESRLVRKAQVLKTKYGASEELIYNILQRIAPDLTTVPFAEDRWAFEKQHPYSRYDVEHWIARKPHYADTIKGSFNWRKNVLVNYKKEFQEVIYSVDNSPLFDVVDKKALTELFDKTGNNLGKYDTLLWSLYTGTILLSNKWIDGPIENSRINVSVPEGETVKKSGVLKQIKLIPGDKLKPSNPKVKVQTNSPITSFVQWEQTQKEDRLYFQTFDKPFSTPPSTEYHDICSVQGQEMEFCFEIEKFNADFFSLDFYVIQYDKEQRIKSEKVNFGIYDQQKIYSHKVKTNPKATTFKLAFMIRDNQRNGSFGIHQIRLNVFV